MSWWDEQDDRRRAAISAVLDCERGQQYLRYAGGDRGFAAWLLVADAICTRRLGVSIFDIADWAWRDAYDAGQTPGEALREALHADDTFAMLLGGQE
jgi:hypothetical protein